MRVNVFATPKGLILPWRRRRDWGIRQLKPDPFDEVGRLIETADRPFRQYWPGG